MNSTREIILQKAFGLFLQHGYDNVSMAILQKETGLSRGALYHHFKSKEQIFIEVIETFYIMTPTTTSKPLNITTLDGFYHDYLAHISMVFKMLRVNMNGASSVNDCNFFSLGLDAMRRYPGFKEKIRIINKEIHKIWVSVIKTAREKGEIKSVMKDEQIADFFIYSNGGIGMQYTIEGRGIEAEGELLQLWDGFYQQIKHTI